jgi:hypothetical protein
LLTDDGEAQIQRDILFAFSFFELETREGDSKFFIALQMLYRIMAHSTESWMVLALEPQL